MQVSDLLSLSLILSSCAYPAVRAVVLSSDDREGDSLVCEKAEGVLEEERRVWKMVCDDKIAYVFDTGAKCSCL